MVIGKKLEQFLEDVYMVRVSSSSTLRGSLRKILKMEYTRCSFRMLRSSIKSSSSDQFMLKEFN